jgi:hypothetical protein
MTENEDMEKAFALVVNGTSKVKANAETGGSKKDPAKLTLIEPTANVEITESAVAGGNRLRTSEEMASIILKAIASFDGAPQRGFEITVYGYRPWNAMLMIKPEAGPIADPAIWRDRVADIAFV